MNYEGGPNPYLTRERALDDPARVRELYYGKEKFPFQDPPFPKRYIAPMASGSAVRSDNPFDEIRVPVRGTIAIDMEGATFYRTVTEFPDVRALLVKGVCDYADTDKDGSYHEYASAVSAIYMVCFIKDYVTHGLMPRPGHQLPASQANSIDQPPPASDLRRVQPIDFPAEAHTSLTAMHNSVQSLRRRDMPGIPSKMYTGLRQTLAACGPFKEQQPERILHTAPMEKGTSGVPVLNITNRRVVALHTGEDESEQLREATLLRAILRHIQQVRSDLYRQIMDVQ